MYYTGKRPNSGCVSFSGKAKPPSACFYTLFIQSVNYLDFINYIFANI